MQSTGVLLDSLWLLGAWGSSTLCAGAPHHVWGNMRQRTALPFITKQEADTEAGSNHRCGCLFLPTQSHLLKFSQSPIAAPEAGEQSFKTRACRASVNVQSVVVCPWILSVFSFSLTEEVL